MSVPKIAWGLILGFWQCEARAFCSKAWAIPYSKCEQRLVALIFWWPRILALLFWLGGWMGRISSQHHILTTLATSQPASHMSSEPPSCSLQKVSSYQYYIIYIIAYNIYTTDQYTYVILYITYMIYDWWIEGWNSTNIIWCRYISVKGVVMIWGNQLTWISLHIIWKSKRHTWSLNSPA